MALPRPEQIKSDMERLAAKRAAVERAVHEERARQSQQKQEQKQELARRRAEQAKTVASKVEEAGVAAQEAASVAPVLTVAELLDMRQSRLRMKEALLDEAAAFSKDDVNHLRFRLGEAILSSGKTIQTLFKEWDKNNDGGAHRPCLHTSTSANQRGPCRLRARLTFLPCTLILAHSSLHTHPCTRSRAYALRVQC